MSLLDTISNVMAPAAGFAARPPAQLNVVAPLAIPPLGAVITRTVDVVVASNCVLPMWHWVEVPLAQMLFDAVMVSVSPLTRAVVTVITKASVLGVAPAVFVDGVALVQPS